MGLFRKLREIISVILKTNPREKETISRRMFCIPLEETKSSALSPELFEKFERSPKKILLEK